MKKIIYVLIAFISFSGYSQTIQQVDGLDPSADTDNYDTVSGFEVDGLIGRAQVLFNTCYVIHSTGVPERVRAPVNGIQP